MVQQLLRRFRGYGCSMIGACRVVAYCQDVVVILNSPLGCAHILRDRELVRNYQPNNPLRGLFNSIERKIVYTNLTDNDTIYGSADKLRACIKNVVLQYKPRYIIIANSCMVGVIGDDIGGIVGELEDLYHLPIIPINSFGFMNGAYSRGFFLTTSMLLERFVKLTEKRSNKKVILIAPFEGKNSTAFKTVAQILFQLGIEQVILFPGAASFQEFEQFGQCKYGIVLDHTNMLIEDYKAAAKLMQKKLQLEILDYPDPMGLQATLKWISSVSKQIQADKEVSDTMILSIKKEYDKIRNDFLKKVGQENKVSIVIRDAKVILNFNWLEEILSDLQISVEAIYVDKTNSAQGNVVTELLNSNPKFNEIPCLFWDEAEIINEVADKNILSIRVPREVLPSAVQLPYMNMGFGIAGIKQLVSDLEKMLLIKKNRAYYE